MKNPDNIPQVGDTLEHHKWGLIFVVEHGDGWTGVDLEQAKSLVGQGASIIERDGKPYPPTQQQEPLYDPEIEIWEDGL